MWTNCFRLGFLGFIVLFCYYNGMEQVLKLLRMKGITTFLSNTSPLEFKKADPEQSLLFLEQTIAASRFSAAKLLENQIIKKECVKNALDSGMTQLSNFFGSTVPEFFTQIFPVIATAIALLCQVVETFLKPVDKRQGLGGVGTNPGDGEDDREDADILVIRRGDIPRYCLLLVVSSLLAFASCKMTFEVLDLGQLFMKQAILSQVRTIRLSLDFHNAGKLNEEKIQEGFMSLNSQFLAVTQKADRFQEELNRLNDFLSHHNESYYSKNHIMLWVGDEIPTGWRKCDGVNNTPNLADRFIVAAGGKYKVRATGGKDEITLSTDQLPPHNHVREELFNRLVRLSHNGEKDTWTGHGDHSDTEFSLWDTRPLESVGKGSSIDIRPQYVALLLICKV